MPCESNTNTSKPIAFEVTRKRRKGYPTEARVKRGERIVHGEKELLEKLGRNDRAGQGADFRHCCMISGGFDDSQRHYFFRD